MGQKGLTKTLKCSTILGMDYVLYEGAYGESRKSWSQGQGTRKRKRAVV